MKLSQLAEEIGGELKGDAEFSSLCTDSRVAGKGDLFLCFRGTSLDAHDFIAEAEGRGAVALVCEHDVESELPKLIVPDGREAYARIAAAFYGHPERYLSVIGVTGTNGKTTVAHMVRAIFEEAGIKTGIIGTLGARYGETSVSPALTTPDPAFLFSLLADMRNAGVKKVVMEVSAHALALKKDCPITYDVAIFTNLSQDHLDFFDDMERYGAAKRTLFSPARCRLAVLNSDDAFSDKILAGDCAPAVTYGIENPADCFAVVEREELRGSAALLNLEDDLCAVELRMAGRHNVYNALAAATAAKRMGVDTGAIARGLAKAHAEGRLERVGAWRGADIFVDFAHTPDGLQKSLEALREHTQGRLMVVFGCGGNRDRGKRPIMGRTAAKNCDFAFITSDNPRYEDPCAIIAEIEAGYREVSDSYIAIEEREKAIACAIKRLKKGDVLLVAGKGGETTQEIMGIKYSYNDKAMIKSLLEKL